MADLYRYSLKEPLDLAGGREAIIVFTRPSTKLKTKKGKFLTPDLFSSAIPAHEYLSLSFFPKFRNVFTVDSSLYTLFDNEGRAVKLSSLGSLPRVWPAWGQNGGARELIIAQRTKNNPLSAVRAQTSPALLPDGGETDAYRQDGVQDYHFAFAMKIVEGIYNSLRGVVLPEGDREWSAKINENSHPALDLRQDSRHYTISVAYRLLPSQMNLRFWGYLWRDEAPARRIYGPLKDSYTVEHLWNRTGRLDEEFVRRTLKAISTRSYSLNDISEIAKQILTRLTNVTDIFFEKYAISQFLQPP